MAGQQRKCANCRFFSDAGMPGNGWCTHPKRQLASGVKLLVRGGELACRNSWGGDLFQSNLEDEGTPVAAADLPGGDQDDEVTSVTIPTTRPAPSEDRVVRDRPAAQRPDPSDSNDAYHRDQEERARIMARGSRDAVAQARQRYSTRHQPSGEEHVVADDNLPVAGSDRVVTRQERFSDRGSASSMPPMRTAPVPRDEIRQRSGGEQDRFDTVPAIDPDFDMPAQREQAAAPAPPDPVDGPAPAPKHQAPVAEPQVTAYEHVLQRARRIRASKQDRMQPIRHADVLLGREITRPDDADNAPSADRSYQAGEWRHEAVDAEAAAELEPYDIYTNDTPQWDDTDDVSLDAEAGDDGVWDGSYGEVEEIAASWTDEDDAWYDDDVEELDQPEPRRSGWLSRLRLGHRASEPTYDDATITRHADSSHSYFDDAPLEDDRGWVQPETSPAQSWSEDNVTNLPDLRGDTRVSAYTDDGFAAPVPPPVPAAERHAGTSDATAVPMRPASPSRGHQHLAAALPDLDDALFDDREDRVLHPQHPGSRHDEIEALEASGTRSPRDSYFRASHYPRPEQRLPFADGPEPETSGVEATLPDLAGDRLDVRDVVARGAELIDRRIEVAPDIPRQCRTCRSFRSADGGTRGWCTNEWAFTHRRMVNDDDLACVSAIGCWWMPADHLRLDLGDETGDVRTPRMDELIASKRPAARRASGE